MSDVFEYSGYHFTPHRCFCGKTENGFEISMKKMRTDTELGMFPDRNRKDFKTEYNYDDFYAASTDKTCDIFRCVENGRLYVPGANELFGFDTSRPKDRSDAR